jgi:Zn-dependent protease with chaperone function
MIKTSARAKCISVVMACTLLLSQGFAVSPGPELPDPGNAPMTRQQQIQLGFQAAAQVYQQMPVLPDSSPETQYIRKLGARLAATIPAQYSWPFEFHVIPQKEINAFALPGGPMFVNVGTITAASSEAELAGVMAHEMSHVYMQHSAKQAGKTQTTAAIAGIAGAILGAVTGGSMLGQLAEAGIQFGAQGVILKYSRGDEAQADAVGAIIMYKAGYNPQALADFFQKLTTQGGEGPQFLSDHPNPGNREQAIQQEIANWPPKHYVTTSAEFDAAKKHAQTVEVYSAQQISAGAKTGQWSRLNKQNGAVFQAPAGVAVNTPASAPASSENSSTGPAAPVSLQNVLPSSRMVATDLGPLKISYPDNWQLVAPSQRGADIRIAPPAGVSGDSIGYGVLLNGVKPQHGEEFDQLTNELVQELVKDGGDLRTTGGPQTIDVAGSQGRSIIMESTSPFPDAKGQPQKERDWLVTVPRGDGSMLYFVFVAPRSQFDQFQPTFNNMLNSIKLK